MGRDGLHTAGFNGKEKNRGGGNISWKIPRRARASWKAQDSSPLFQVGRWEDGKWVGGSGSQPGLLHVLGYFFNVCVNVCIVHNTHFLLGYLHLEGRGVTFHFNMICLALALSLR